MLHLREAGIYCKKTQNSAFQLSFGAAVKNWPFTPTADITEITQY